VLKQLLYMVREAFPPNRVAVLLTPVFAIAAGWLATQAAKYAPGLPGFGETELTAFFVAGAGAALAAAYKWIDGWAKWETTEALQPIPLEDVDPDEVDLDDDLIDSGEAGPSPDRDFPEGRGGV
jgi:hypothetical protein